MGKLKKAEDQCTHIENMKKNIEQKNKELQVKLDIAEQDATVSKRKETKLLEGHIKELEAELRSEQIRTLESVQIARKLERRFKEFKYKQETDTEKILRLTELTEK